MTLSDGTMRWACALDDGRQHYTVGKDYVVGCVLCNRHRRYAMVALVLNKRLRLLANKDIHALVIGDALASLGDVASAVYELHVGIRNISARVKAASHQGFFEVGIASIDIMQKDVPFEFDKKCQEAFDTLKEKLTTTPILQPTRWDVPFEIMCDASNLDVGAVLGQRVEKKSHVICFASRILNPNEINYITSEKEFLAIVFALDKFHSYIIGFPITIYTDHAALSMDFMGPFSSSFGYLYILLAVDYVWKWVEAIPTMTKNVVTIEALMRKYGVHHHIVTLYHPQQTDKLKYQIERPKPCCGNQKSGNWEGIQSDRALLKDVQ
ncbi:uncharacterized protein LOC120078053 [Benincasa hispida]|uniref:uncharacterized protein LOC120078053 n=1 Tax=Benincasa hispida TaxID=102211 RepID=UPI001902BA35|nr:uncharacterized protein LOC120078053 [Benincasa hispida]